MAPLKDRFAAINHDERTVVKFARDGSKYVATWEVLGKEISREYEESVIRDLFDSGYLFMLSNGV